MIRARRGRMEVSAVSMKATIAAAGTLILGGLTADALVQSANAAIPIGSPPAIALDTHIQAAAVKNKEPYYDNKNSTNDGYSTNCHHSNKGHHSHKRYSKKVWVYDSPLHGERYPYE